MQDRLTFTSERRGDHVAVICRGHDHTGQPVHFEVDAATFLANSERQQSWAARVDARDHLMQTFVKIGVSPDKAWEMVEHALPDNLYLGTGWRSGPMDDDGANGHHELLEGSDNLSGHIGDGDH
jgi:hypothetical protein